MVLASLGLAFLAGVVSILSPCVLPLLPVVLGAAVSEHRLGPVALAAGIALSFLALGLLVATVGFAIGLDGDTFRTAAAVLLLVVGGTLLLPALQARLSLAAAPVGAWAATWADTRFGGGARRGCAGQFGVGLLLGAVWTPCAGPTLGAASVLAAQGKDLSQVALTMLLFAVGAALPLVGLGLASRAALLHWRGRMLAGGRAGKVALGFALVGAGVLIVGGYDRRLESALLDLAPGWLTGLSSGF